VNVMGDETTRPQAALEDQGVSRRGFLKIGVGALGVLAALEVGGAGVIFLQSRGGKGDYGGVVEVGLAESFPLGSVTEFPRAGFFLVRTQEGGFLAIHRRCPHLGCTVDWEPDEDRFYCPCHGSSFDSYGNYDGPPVPRALDIFSVTIEDGFIKVDTSQVQTRENFSPDQLAYDAGGREL
jgi:cytochrome b6-f complex iron-sulfur subunit